MVLEQTLKKAEKVPGLKKHLESVSKYRGYDWSMNGSAHLVDVRINIEEQAAAYIVEEHEWDESGHSGIEHAVRVGAFRRGKSASSDKIVYIDISRRYKDDQSKAYNKIIHFKVCENKVRVRVASDQAERDFEWGL